MPHPNRRFRAIGSLWCSFASNGGAVALWRPGRASGLRPGSALPLAGGVAGLHDSGAGRRAAPRGRTM